MIRSRNKDNTVIVLIAHGSGVLGAVFYKPLTECEPVCSILIICALLLWSHLLLHTSLFIYLPSFLDYCCSWEKNFPPVWKRERASVGALERMVFHGMYQQPSGPTEDAATSWNRALSLKMRSDSGADKWLQWWLLKNTEKYQMYQNI